jgi:hypothetical protein
MFRFLKFFSKVLQAELIFWIVMLLLAGIIALVRVFI